MAEKLGLRLLLSSLLLMSLAFPDVAAQVEGKGRIRFPWSVVVMVWGGGVDVFNYLSSKIRQREATEKEVGNRQGQMGRLYRLISQVSKDPLHVIYKCQLSVLRIEGQSLKHSNQLSCLARASFRGVGEM